MVGELTPKLTTQITPTQTFVADPSNVGRAFSGFFRSIGESQRQSVVDVKFKRDTNYGEALARALSLNAQGKDSEAQRLVKQATVDYVASGGSPSEAHSDIYEGITGQPFAAIAAADQEEFDRQQWALSKDAAGFMSLARQYNKTQFNNSLTDEQLVEFAWATSQEQRANEQRRVNIENGYANGIVFDDKGVARDVEKMVKEDLSLMLGFVEKAFEDDGRVTQDELMEATSMVADLIGNKYSGISEHNESVKATLGEIGKLLESLGKLDPSGTEGVRDIFWQASLQIEDPISRALFWEMLETPEGQKEIQTLREGLEGIVSFGEAVRQIRIPTAALLDVPTSGQILGAGTGGKHGSWEDYSLGTPLEGRVTGLPTGTQPTPLDTPEKQEAGKTIIKASTGFISQPLPNIGSDKAVRDQFITFSLLNAETIASQQDTVLGGKLLEEFSSPGFLKNLKALFTVDDEAGVRVQQAYTKAVASEVNRIQLAISSLSRSDPDSVINRYDILQMDEETGEMSLNFELYDEHVESTGDPVMINSWEQIKVLIEEEGLGPYLENPDYIGKGRGRNIDSFMGGNIREIYALTLKMQTAIRKSAQLDTLAKQFSESMDLYLGPPIPTRQQEIEAAVQQANAEAIGDEAVQTLDETISATPLPPMEQVAAEEGTRESPFSPNWTGDEERDVQIYNLIPDGAYVVMPDGSFGRKTGDI